MKDNYGSESAPWVFIQMFRGTWMFTSTGDSTVICLIGRNLARVVFHGGFVYVPFLPYL